ncbi:MAG TPA: integration host factor subunit beta [Planctomycetes bacterium]|nr:integration host factor subunit beta [Planctomycetota bacterium]
MATITKKELVNRIAAKTGQTKVVTKLVIQMFLDEIIDELSHGNRLEFREFGVFEVKERAARKAQNPRTLEKVEVPAKKVVKFKVGRLMKSVVAGEESLPVQGSDVTPASQPVQDSNGSRPHPFSDS